MRQSLEILNVFSSLTLKQVFSITEIFFKKLENFFLDESTVLKAQQHVHIKTANVWTKIVDLIYQLPKYSYSRSSHQRCSVKMLLLEISQNS